ncbi:MAG: DUF721 domain-containing protein [Candidatus Omnitrophota bacterium]
MKDRNPKRIAEVLNDILKRPARDSKESPSQLETAWRESVGEKILKHTMPVSFGDKRLVVHVDNSVWLYQLGFLKEEILGKLKKFLGEDAIDELYFRIGKI